MSNEIPKEILSYFAGLAETAVWTLRYSFSARDSQSTEKRYFFGVWIRIATKNEAVADLFVKYFPKANVRARGKFCWEIVLTSGYALEFNELINPYIVGAKVKSDLFKEYKLIHRTNKNNKIRMSELIISTRIAIIKRLREYNGRLGYNKERTAKRKHLKSKPVSLFDGLF